MSVIVYSGQEEVLVTTPETEEAFLQEWFTEGGRDMSYYDREEYKTGVEISSALRFTGDQIVESCKACGSQESPS